MLLLLEQHLLLLLQSLMLEVRLQEWTLARSIILTLPRKDPLLRDSFSTLLVKMKILAG